MWYWHDRHDGWGLVWMIALMALFWLPFILALLWFVGGGRRREHGGPTQDSPLEAARHRLARGEIKPEEYDEIVRRLTGSAPGAPAP